MYSSQIIQVQVQDETGSTTFILFDKGAKKIISKTAKELAEMQEEKMKNKSDWNGTLRLRQKRRREKEKEMDKKRWK
ncbi:hypothetical protein CFP56_026248 [Quercus suber]|uniref:Replication factor A C-terminal domain-containing protein n=1 Tax=Quercus suber TaxID=58331 RepID=A0AAW0K1N3_QUESU